MKIEESLKAIKDLDSLIDRLTKYAYDRLKSNNIKDFEGREPIDFVAEVLCKSLEGTRDFDKAKCTFEEFLFGCVKSDIDAFFKKKKRFSKDDIPEGITLPITNNVTELKEHVINWLEVSGATPEEVLIFDFWTDGISKPSTIAKELGITSTNVYNASKRLERRLNVVRHLIDKLQ